MGNCQAAEAATVVIQHPGGRTERVYWSVAASQVMAANPGHYVALIITTLPSSSSSATSSSSIRSGSSSSRSSTTAVKHLKLLRPDDTLCIGHTYRLVSFEEVLREFASKRHVKLSRLLVKHKEKPAARRRSSSSSGDGSGSSSNSRGNKIRSSSNDDSNNDTTSNSKDSKIRSSSTDDSSNDTSSNSRDSKDRSGDGCRDEQRCRTQVNESESSLAMDQAAETVDDEPSTENEAETDQELELVVRGMMGGGGGGMTTVSRRGHWRPTLQSIAEGVGS